MKSTGHRPARQSDDVDLGSRLRRQDAQFLGRTLEAVRSLRAGRTTTVEFARFLLWAADAYCRHRRRLGIESDHMPA